MVGVPFQKTVGDSAPLAVQWVDERTKMKSIGSQNAHEFVITKEEKRGEKSVIQRESGHLVRVTLQVASMVSTEVGGPNGI